MTTIQESKLDTLTLGASELSDLLVGAGVAMDKGKQALDRLSSIYLSAGEGKVTVKASDRYRLIVGESELAGESVPVNGITFNPNYMADFGKVPTSNKSGAMLTMEFTGESKPIRVTIPHDTIKWSALLMPMRVSK